MSYTYENDNLLYDGKVIYTAPDRINECVADEFNHRAILIYRGYGLVPDKDRPDALIPNIEDPELQKLVNQNVLCIDKEGQIVWRIEATSKRPHDHVFFMSPTDGLWTHRRDGEEFKIDKNTGKILAQRLGAR